MKEYRLASWPELSPPFNRAGHRRILSDMSQSHLTVAKLVERSGLKRLEVVQFIESLEAAGHVHGRDAVVEPLLQRCARRVGTWARRMFIGVYERP